MNNATLIRDLLIKKGLSAKEIHKETSFSLKYVKSIVSDINNGGGDTCRLRKGQKKYRINNKKQRNHDRRTNYAKGRLYAIKAKKPYSKKELDLIKGGFVGDDRDLAKLIGRSVQAIQIKRSRIE